MPEPLIDVVIMWVDGADPEWLREKRKYLKDEPSMDDSINRYRSWDNLEYVFRGIERFMPWVRKVHFVTWGHLPSWLNLESGRLNVVRHQDFIPSEYLPTFSSHSIELNLHRIEGLSDRFVLFNDDTFVVRSTESDFFFTENGSPREQAMFATLGSHRIGDIFPHILLNNNAIMNAEFKASEVIARGWRQIYSPRNGLYSSLKNIAMLPFSLKSVQVLNTPHMPSPILKEVMQEVWEKYPGVMSQTSVSKFRSSMDVNQYIFRQWQILSGRFWPFDFGKHSSYVSSFPKDLPVLRAAFSDERCHLVCINDDEVTGSFEAIKQQVNDMLDERLPYKSKFEV